MMQHQMETIIRLQEMKKRRSPAIKRTGEWWNSIVAQDYPDEEMLKNFRMKKETFFYIVDTLYEDLKPSQLAFQQCLDVAKIVAIAIFKLASCAEYRVVGNLFGVHKCTVKKCLDRFCKIIIKNMLKKHIALPNSVEDLKNVISDFKNICNVSPIVGAIDGTHIPITPPKNGFRDYINRKGWASLVLQVVVNTKLKIRDLSIRHPGSCHDATVFKDSLIYKNFEKNIPFYEETVDGVQIRPFLIGDPAYPLLPWLMKGFTGQRTVEEESFNTYLSSGRVVVEQAIGRLKGRWRMICKKIDTNHCLVPQIVVSACCILHNIVEENKERFSEVLLREVEEVNRSYVQPTRRSNNTFESSAVVIRKHLEKELHRFHPFRRSNFL